MNTLPAKIRSGLLIIGLTLYGCGGEPYTYEPENELKPGPGLFSGEDGEFTLIGSPKNEKEEQENKK